MVVVVAPPGVGRRDEDEDQLHVGNLWQSERRGGGLVQLAAERGADAWQLHCQCKGGCGFQLTASAMLVVARMCLHAASPSARCGSVELLRRELTWFRGRSFNLRIVIRDFSQ